MKKEQIDILRETFEEWLQIEGFDYDFSFYSPSDWKARGEEILCDAELIFVFENQLLFILNYTGPTEIEDELRDLARGFGYYFEIGDVWNIGFYPLEDILTRIPSHSLPYSELLQHPMWQEKRKRIYTRSGGKCEDCGGTNYLEVHHCYYRYGRLPWQYPDASLLHLCRSCHEARGRAELKLRGFLPKLRSRELLTIRKVLQDGLYWYPRKPLWDFIESIGYDIEKCHSNLKALIPLRGHEEDRNSS